MQVDFYHLTRTPVERALPQIAEKVLASGVRLLVVSADAGQRAAIDQQLWAYAPASFLPHGEAGAAFDADQPVLIADAVPDDGAAANGAAHVALIDGQWRDAALHFARAFHFFDERAIAEARTAWKALGAHGEVERRYWKQDETGRWERAA